MSRRGFTLLEVLVATALVLTLGGAMFVFFFNLLDTRARVLERVARQQAADTLIDRAEADLATCLAGDRTRGAGVAGDATSLRLLTRRITPAPSAPDAGLADLHRVEYRFDRGAHRVEARRTDPGGSASGAFAPVGGVVDRVRFRYLDDGAWRPSFDSLARGRLPEAVEIAVWFEPPADAPLLDEVDDPSDEPALDAADLDDLAADFDDLAGLDELDGLAPADERPPDRRRVILVPDGGAP
ncbi:MAG: type II secretion system protein GspJ [Planctomycetota bacterium]